MKSDKSNHAYITVIVVCLRGYISKVKVGNDQEMASDVMNSPLVSRSPIKLSKRPDMVIAADVDAKHQFKDVRCQHLTFRNFRFLFYRISRKRLQIFS